MKKNVGDADSFIRFMVGLAFLLNIIILEPPFIQLLILLVLGLFILKSAFTRSCPLYIPLNVNTCGDSFECKTEESVS